MADLSEFESKRTQTHPKGWEPSVVWNGQSGTIATGPLEHEPGDAIWQNLIADWGLDPATTRIVPGSVQIRAWDANVGGGDVQRLHYYRATIEPHPREGDRADIDALCRMVTKRKPRKAHVVDIERSLLVLLSDFQLGKGEGGGTDATAARIMASLNRMVEQVKSLARQGRPVSSVHLVGMGDIVEQCDGHYDMQAFSVDLDRREQMKLARRIILAYIDAVVDLGLPCVVGCVPGNHGENRRNGKAFTTWTDNDDLACFEQVAEILDANSDRYANVSVPLGAIAQELTMTLDIAGVAVGFAHGHQMRTGTVEKWWQGQALGRQAVADADILITGHKHHLLVSESSGRTHMQCPAQDGGSYWWTAQTGQSSAAGLLTVVVGKHTGPRGWSDLAVL